MNPVLGSAAVVVLEKVVSGTTRSFFGEWNTHCFLGAMQEGDKILFSEKIRKSGCNKSLSLRHKYEIPYSGKEKISYVEVIGVWRDGTGGKVAIKSGGVGHNYVFITLTSQKLRGMAFDVKIYGQ